MSVTTEVPQLGALQESVPPQLIHPTLKDY